MSSNTPEYSDQLISIPSFSFGYHPKSAPKCKPVKTLFNKMFWHSKIRMIGRITQNLGKSYSIKVPESITLNQLRTRNTVENEVTGSNSNGFRVVIQQVYIIWPDPLGRKDADKTIPTPQIENLIPWLKTGAGQHRQSAAVKAHWRKQFWFSLKLELNAVDYCLNQVNRLLGALKAVAVIVRLLVHIMFWTNSNEKAMSLDTSY